MAGEKRAKGKGNAVGCGCLWAMVTLALLAFGTPLYLGGTEQVELYEQLSPRTGEQLRATEEGRTVLVGGRLADGHPIVEPSEQLICAERHRDYLGARPDNENYARNRRLDDEASIEPPLTLLVDDVEVTLEPPYSIVRSDHAAVGSESTEYIRYDYYGFRNNEAIAARGELGRASDGSLSLSNGHLIADEPSAFLRYHRARIYPEHQIGMGLSIAGLILLVVGSVLLGLRIRRFVVDLRREIAEARARRKR